MDLLEALREYGLSENEIKLYLALVKAGESSAQKIAKSAGIPRTTCYHLLERLEQKGLTGFVIKDSKKYFSPAPPQRLISTLDEKKKIIKDILPQLTLLSASLSAKPKATIFEGVKGVRAVLKDVLTEKKIIYHYGDIISIERVFAHVFPQYISERVKKKIPIRIIGQKEEPHEGLLKSSKKELREFLFIPREFHFDSSVFIYSNKVAIFNIREEPYFAIIIDNKDFFNTQKNFFELLWNAYKRPSRTK